MISNIVKIGIVSVIYILLLFSIAPIIDHAFTPLHKDETNGEILFEIITQLLTVSFIWYIINQYVLSTINKYFGIHKDKLIETIMNIISSLILIGLQSHLINKLRYITHEHPFRFFKIFNN